MRRNFEYMTLITLLFLLTVFSACSPSTQPRIIVSKESTLQNQKIKLRFISSWGGSDPSADTLQQVLNRFTDMNPDIEVLNESTFAEDFLYKLKIDFASGYNPDVFGLWPGSDIRALIKAGKVADLTELLDSDRQWKDSFKKDMWSYNTMEGRIYGLPLEIIYEALFINKDLFQKYNAPIPTTYEELKRAVQVFRRNNIVPIAYNSLAEGTYIYQNIAAMLGGRKGIEEPVTEGRINQCYIDAMGYMKELYELGAFPKEAFNMNSRDRNNLFLNKQAAMIVQGSWFTGSLGDKADTVDIIPFPRMKEEGDSTGALVYGLGNGNFHMSRTAWDDSRKREAAVKLLKALTSKDTAYVFARQRGMLSNVTIDESAAGYSPLVERGRELLNHPGERIGPPDSFVDRSAWEGIIVEKFPYVLEGALSAEAVWEEALKKSIQ